MWLTEVTTFSKIMIIRKGTNPFPSVKEREKTERQCHTNHRKSAAKTFEFKIKPLDNKTGGNRKPMKMRNVAFGMSSPDGKSQI